MIVSCYKSCLQVLHILPLMYIYELNDIMFFIKSYKSPQLYFNINQFLSFSSSATRFSKSAKLVHQQTTSRQTYLHYFCRTVRLWNSLPPMDISLNTSILKTQLMNFLWTNFVENFDPDHVCSYHYLCPSQLHPVSLTCRLETNHNSYNLR